MRNGLDLPDVAQELVPQTLTFAGTLDQSCNINDFQGGRNTFFRFDQLIQFLQPLVLNRNDSHIGFDRAEGVICCFCFDPSQGTKEGGFADIWQPDDSENQTHSNLLLSTLPCCRQSGSGDAD